MNDITTVRVFASVLVLGLVSSAGAQEHAAPAPAPQPSTEIAATGSLFVPAQVAGIGVRIGIPLDEPFTFEAGIDWMNLGRTVYQADRIVWFYFLQARQRIAVTPRSHPTSLFLTYGTAGWAERSLGPAGFGTSFILPMFPLTGLAAQHVVGRYGALRGDAQVLWFYGDDFPVAAFRVMVGVTVPIRGYGP